MHGALHGAKALGQRKDLDALEEGTGGFNVAADAECHHAAEPRALALGNLVARVGLEAGVHDVADLWVGLKVAGNADGVLGMLRHADWG